MAISATHHQCQWLDLGDDLTQMSQQTIRQWSQLKHFYRLYMPYAKPSIKESVAIIAHLPQPSSQTSPQPDTQVIMCAIRIRSYANALLLTGLLTHPQYRQQGLASQLLQFIRPQCQAIPSFVFAESDLTSFYLNHGFVVITPEEATAEIRQQFCKYQTKLAKLTLLKHG
ncbi:GNAT family N-acetyltransferase [Shewanella maritima]|uniref:GNAT family N-acetyltransferase n=1 Tax=Shewanella maritima TaxID=2520507 RepID=UPI0037352B47